MIWQWRQTLFHPPLRMQQSAEKEGEKEHEDGAYYGPFDGVGCLCYISVLTLYGGS